MSTPGLAHRFTYHPPLTPERIEAHELVRDCHLDLAEVLDSVLPDGREKAVVLTNLEQSMFWSNAAIARAHYSESGD